MAPIRFRLRTIMILVAVLAALMGMIRILAPWAGVSSVSLGYMGSTLSILVEMQPTSYPSVSGGTFHIYTQTNAIPLTNFNVPAIAACVALAAVVIYRLRRRRRR